MSQMFADRVGWHSVKVYRPCPSKKVSSAEKLNQPPTTSPNALTKAAICSGFPIVTRMW
jgi:hypothetical protein